MSRILVVAMVLISVSLALPTAAAPPEIADCPVFKVWHFDKGAEGWLPDHNVSEFTIENGVLSFENTGSDPWIINTEPGGPDASKYHFVGVRMRSSASGRNQIYFGTDKSPGTAEGKVVHYPIVGDDEFHFYEVDVSQVKTWDGKVTVLRLDPANGGEEVGAKIEIDWIALYQQPARITIGRPYAGMDGEEVVVSIPVMNVGGEPSEPGMVVTANGKQQAVGPVEPHKRQNVVFRLKDREETINVTGTLGGKPQFRAVLCSPADTWGVWCAPPGALIPGLMLEFRPLATLAYSDSGGVLNYLEVAPGEIDTAEEDEATMHATCPIEGGEAHFRWSFRRLSDCTDSTTCELTTTAPLDVLRFEGPRLLAGEDSFGSSKTGGLFPGLEYLEKDEPSGGVKHIGPKYADRHVPHPYKVAVPLMAVETEEGVVGISWDPLQEWAPGHTMPCAEFESPNKSEGAASHLMTLFVPSIPDYVDENTEFAKNPYRLEPGQTLKIRATLFSREGGRIVDVVPEYYGERGLPKCPPIANGVDGTIALCFKAYTESLYFPEKKGWKNHFGLHQTPSFNNGFAASILGESLRTGDPDLARKCELDPGGQLVQYLGTTLDWFSGKRRGQVDAVVAGQSADGGFPYAINQEMIEKVKKWAEIAGTDATTLGDLGETNSGLIVRQLNGILAYALQTGGQKYIDAGIKGLARLNSFTVPRGAQTWEVHAHVPDIYAAGLAVDANIAGYHLTGDDEYLEHAKFWAFTGVPFVYGWVPPIEPVPSGVFHFDEQGEGKNPVIADPSEYYENVQRRVNPGATIPVFGTSFYVVNWFGTPVQWCGLAWANSVRRYTRLRPDATLDAVADLVFASGTQQQTEKGFLAGTYPDSWNLIANRANAAFITPDLILDYAYAIKGEKRPQGVESVGFGRERAFLSTYARIEDLETFGGGLEAALKFYAGQDLYACVSRVGKPSKVTVNGMPLSEARDLRTARAGYYYDVKSKALHVKYRVPKRTARLRINW